MKFLLLLIWSLPAMAYIPEYSMIASRAADQHGKGAYLIEQDVTYRKDSDAFTVKETWLVNDENHMRLTVEGRGPLKGLVQGSVIFQGPHKYFIENGSGVHNLRLGEEWLEPLFHFRSGKYLRSRLVNLKIAPQESLSDRASLSSEGEPTYQAPGFIRLSRVGGALAWAIGLPGNGGARSQLWLEQDQFVLRKFREGEQLVLRANDYGKYDQGLWFPRQRSYTFGSFTIEFSTLQVRSLGKLRPDDIRFKPTGLNAQRDTLRLPEVEALKEFYSRFR